MPAGDGLRNTRISWQRQARITAQLCVAENGGEEKLIGQRSKEALNARCVLKGRSLRFELLPELRNFFLLSESCCFESFHFPVLLQKLIEQHRVHCFIAHGL